MRTESESREIFPKNGISIEIAKTDIVFHALDRLRYLEFVVGRIKAYRRWDDTIDDDDALRKTLASCRPLRADEIQGLDAGAPDDSIPCDPTVLEWWRMFWSAGLAEYKSWVGIRSNGNISLAVDAVDHNRKQTDLTMPPKAFSDQAANPSPETALLIRVASISGLAFGSTSVVSEADSQVKKESTMAFNPSPEVQVARDAAEAMRVAVKADKIDACVVIWVDDQSRTGYASYGRTSVLCGFARRIADAAFEALADSKRFEMVCEATTKGAKRATDGSAIDFDVVEAEVIGKLRLLKASLQAEMDAATRTMIVRDLVMPAAELLGRFCACVNIIEEPQGA